MGHFEEEGMKYCLQLQIFTIIFVQLIMYIIKQLVLNSAPALNDITGLNGCYQCLSGHRCVTIHIYHCTASIENHCEPSFHAPLDLLLEESRYSFDMDEIMF